MRPWVAVAQLLVLLGIATVTAGCGPAPATGPADEPGATAGPADGPGATAGADPLGGALLDPGGLGRGWLESPTPAQTPPWPWLQADCPAYRDQDYPAQQYRRDAVQRRYWHEQSNLIATHVVEAYQPGWAARALTDVRRVVGVCSDYVALGGTISFAAVEANFPAEDGLLVRGRIEFPGAPARLTLFVTVRRGDLLSTLNFPDPVDERAAYEAAAKLADLLG